LRSHPARSIPAQSAQVIEDENNRAALTGDKHFEEAGFNALLI
jgi:hypothetical protein